ncbi:MAG: hypothetical protein ACLFVT_07255, partial [Syntrophobacteria bacterium]
LFPSPAGLGRAGEPEGMKVEGRKYWYFGIHFSKRGKFPRGYPGLQFAFETICCIFVILGISCLSPARFC